MNFQSHQLARAIGPSMPNRILQTLLEEVRQEHVSFGVPAAVDAVIEEVCLRLENAAENGIAQGDFDEMPPGYELANIREEASAIPIYEARKDGQAFGVPSEVAQDAVDYAWKNYLWSME